jgi:Zn-dependent M28 family amino/carboxypeptidase
MPEKGGLYFRSDHFPFARKGLPSIHVGSGVEFMDAARDLLAGLSR